ncbi:MAG: hypothetical protein ACRDP6_49825 [Actinoallomurus sp.]
MKTMTSPPEVRTRAAEPTDAPTEITRRRATMPAPPRRPVVERRAATTTQAPFAVLVVGLLGGALVSLLLLNTVLAQQAFTRSELRRENQRLDEREQGLREDVAREDGPEILHAKARRLGMRDAEPGALVPSAAPAR